MNTQIPGRKFLKKRMGLLKCAVLWSGLLSLVATAAWTTPQAASNEPQNMLGAWQGFFQSHPPDPTIPPDPQVPVSSEITSQDMRRINGVMTIIPCTLTLNGTVAANGKVNIQGQDEDHHAVVKLDLHEFGGGAAILNGSLALMAAAGQVTDGSLLLVRPFATPPPGDTIPNPAGLYRGPFRHADGTEGELVVFLTPPDPQRPTSFTGQVVFATITQRLVLDLIGTINAGGRFIAIAQRAGGHVILDATWTGPQNGTSATISGRHTLELNDGSVNDGTFSITGP